MRRISEPATGGIRRVAILPAFCLVLGCFAADSDLQPGVVDQPRPAPRPAELATATLSSFTPEPVGLSDGEWQGEPYVAGGASRPALTLIVMPTLTADLDQDGVEEAVAFVSQTSGGTGNNLYLTAFVRQGDGVVERASVLIGDRVQIRSARIEAGLVRVQVVEAGPSDAACCPGDKADRSWSLESTGWVEQPRVDDGRLSPDDLDGMTWRLVGFSWDERVPPQPQITLETRQGTLSGSSGCNHYTSSLTAGDSLGDLEIAPVASTRKACPPDIMELEQRYLLALGAVNRHSFLMGQLALTYVLDQQWYTLRFSAADPAASPTDD